MTRIAIQAVVDISTDANVMGICDGFVVGMAVGAAEYRVVRRIRMTVGANRPLAGVLARIDRKLVMGKRRSGPGDCRVATGTCFGKSRRHVIWICYRVVLLGMAGVAIRGRPGVNVSHVAGCTCCRRMCSRQSELRIVVIEDGAFPLHRGVA